jgi:hypothetical protein
LDFRGLRDFDALGLQETDERGHGDMGGGGDLREGHLDTTFC